LKRVFGAVTEQAAQVREHGVFLFLVEHLERWDSHGLHLLLKRRGASSCETWCTKVAKWGVVV
jgi:hypothetical protein